MHWQGTFDPFTAHLRLKEMHPLNLGSVLNIIGVTRRIRSWSFAKYANNNGNCVPVLEDATQDLKDLFLKAQTLVHYSYVVTDHKLMLLDIQGFAFTLYDPEIARAEIMDKEHHEIYFCCGNCSSLAITAFQSDHVCSEYCDMMDLK